MNFFTKKFILPFLIESLVILIHPNLLFINLKYWFYKRSPSSTTAEGKIIYDKVYYSYNELTNVFIFSRIYLIVRFIFQRSQFYTNRSKRI